MTRIVLVDDERLFRLGLKELLNLQPGYVVVGEAGDVGGALPAVIASTPDVVIIDLRLAGGSGLDAVRAIRGAGWSVPILLISTFDDEAAFLDGLKVGGNGFLRKDVDIAELTGAIDIVLTGQRYLKPTVTDTARRYLDRIAPDFPHADIHESLTARETDVLRLMAGGLSNREIGQALGTGEATVKSQVSSIIAKLGVRDRIRAVLHALERGLL